MKFSIKDFFSKCDQIRNVLLKTFLKENFIVNFNRGTTTFFLILSSLTHSSIIHSIITFFYNPLVNNIQDPFAKVTVKFSLSYLSNRK